MEPCRAQSPGGCAPPSSIASDVQQGLPPHLLHIGSSHVPNSTGTMPHTWHAANACMPCAHLQLLEPRPGALHVGEPIMVQVQLPESLQLEDARWHSCEAVLPEFEHLQRPAFVTAGGIDGGLSGCSPDHQLCVQLLLLLIPRQSHAEARQGLTCRCQSRWRLATRGSRSGPGGRGILALQRTPETRPAQVDFDAGVSSQQRSESQRTQPWPWPWHGDMAHWMRWMARAHTYLDGVAGEAHSRHILLKLTLRHTANAGQSGCGQTLATTAAASRTHATQGAAPSKAAVRVCRQFSKASPLATPKGLHRAAGTPWLSFCVRGRR